MVVGPTGSEAGRNGRGGERRDFDMPRRQERIDHRDDRRDGGTTPGQRNSDRSRDNDKRDDDKRDNDKRDDDKDRPSRADRDKDDDNDRPGRDGSRRERVENGIRRDENGLPETMADVLKQMLTPVTPPAPVPTPAPSHPPIKTKSSDTTPSKKRSSDTSPKRAEADEPVKATEAAKRTKTTEPDAKAKPVAKVAPGARTDLSQAEARNIVSGEVLAISLSTQQVRQARDLGFTVDARVARGAPNVTVARLKAPSGMGTAEALALLQSHMPPEQFTFNRIYRLYRPQAGDLPGRTIDHAPGKLCPEERCYAHKALAWHQALASCAPSIRVGIVDTGIERQHPAFSATKRIDVRGFRPTERVAAPSWHGTGVLALLAGSPQSGTPGLLPEAHFMVAAVFFLDGDGDMTTDTASLLEALAWMEKERVDIINLSIAGPRDTLVHDAIARMRANGTVFVAAAGNQGPTAPPSYPAAYPEVIAVTAVDREQRAYRHANRGEHIDLAAPGVDVWTAAPGGKETFRSGTSFAAPHVTAVLATLPPAAMKASKQSLLERLQYKDLGAPGRDRIYGHGLVRAPAACGGDGLRRHTEPPEVAESPASSAWQAIVTRPRSPAPAAGPSLGLR